jgi:hypothetical protein
VSIGPVRRAPCHPGGDLGPKDPGANRVVCLGSPTVMRDTRQPRSNADAFAEDGRARTGNSGWRTNPGGHNDHREEVDSVLADTSRLLAVGGRWWRLRGVQARTHARRLGQLRGFAAERLGPPRALQELGAHRRHSR